MIDRTLGGSRVRIKPQWDTSLCTLDLLATELLHLVRLPTRLFEHWVVPGCG